ncbi:MAG: hypothetical protein OEM38_08420 [Gammaproteobacteria bacterium]|nr:hypothetical protein [Gammaproteobacteria bacterium]
MFSSGRAGYAAGDKAHIFPAREINRCHVSRGVLNHYVIDVSTTVAQHPDFKHFTVSSKIATIYNWI